MFKQNVLKDNVLNQNLKELLGTVLEEHGMNKDKLLKDFDVGNDLSSSQKKAFELFKKGDSLLVLGSGGVGKSRLIKTMESYNNHQEFPKNMYLCATTGVSAYNIGGMTIHSFLGLGTGEKDLEFIIRKMSRNKSNIERLRTTDILVVDEISMLSAILFEKINLVCQHFRKNKAFLGGIQVIFTGDILQLLPVFNQNQALLSEPQDTRLIIESGVFNKNFKVTKNGRGNIIILKENFRQKGDSTFIDLLLRVREGSQTNSDIELLQQKCESFQHDLRQNTNFTPVNLVSSNKKAQIINERNLNKLATSEVRYNATFSTSGTDKETCDILKKELESQFKQKGLVDLKLKKDCRVMLLKNLNVDIGLINGSIGTVINFTANEDPIVMFDNGIQKIIEKVEWELEMKDNFVKAKQVPLILAYSITIHKSQGLTLNSAVLDLADCFTDHMVYVALSRLKNLDGLLLKSFNPSKISVNNKMLTFLKQL